MPVLTRLLHVSHSPVKSHFSEECFLHDRISPQNNSHDEDAKREEGKKDFLITPFFSFAAVDDIFLEKRKRILLVFLRLCLHPHFCSPKVIKQRRQTSWYGIRQLSDIRWRNMEAPSWFGCVFKQHVRTHFKWWISSTPLFKRERNKSLENERLITAGFWSREETTAAATVAYFSPPASGGAGSRHLFPSFSWDNPAIKKTLR